LVRHAGPLPTNPGEDDLSALADAVRESRDGSMFPSRGGAALDNLADGAPVAANPAVMAPPAHPVTSGRRRGHLRVLPDPPQ
jgi:hypothetical protein